MASRIPYRLCFASEAAEFLAQLPKSRSRRALRLAQTLAANPFVRSDYAVADESGREQEHLLTEDFRSNGVYYVIAVRHTITIWVVDGTGTGGVNDTVN